MTENKLWYKQPAKTWINGMPIGNGRFGAMVQGKLRGETIAINDDTIWAKVAENRNNPDALAYLPQVRKLLLEGNIGKAAAIAEGAMIGVPRRQSPYQTLGDLSLVFTNHYDDSIEIFREDSDTLDANTQGLVTGYNRSLDLENAIATVAYEMDGIAYKREHFVSGADAVFVVHLTAEGQGNLSLLATLYRRFDGKTHIASPTRVVMAGQSGFGGTKYHTILDVQHKGGTITPLGTNLFIENADEIILTISCETDYRHENYRDVCEGRMNSVQQYSYEALKARHIADYRSYFARMGFALKDNGENAHLPTDLRLAKMREGATDLGLVSTYFNFGRYLLISSSRPGSLPANLQGIWNDSFAPPWDSKYTININTQMNYWPAEACGLGDCHTPLFDMLAHACEKGKITAKAMYDCNGFVVHHNLDAWCDTAPLDHTRAGLWPMGGAWLCFHLWEHYLYSQNRAFLAETAYPIICESAEFLLDYMFEDENGQLLSGPSISPENRYIMEDGQIGFLCISPTMDTQIITGLFTKLLSAAAVLGINNALTSRVKEALTKLPPMKVGAEGILQEWLEDYKEGEPGHRHISHLLGVYPERQITVEETPELYHAARNTLVRRIAHGSGGTGWSEAWIIALWARFKEGELAFGAVETLLRKLTADSLLDIHPPGIFQIDGNLGAVAGMIEMLVSDEDHAVTLFPGIPGSWTEGNVSGLRLKGGLVLNLQWANGKATATVEALGTSNTTTKDVWHNGRSLGRLTLAPGESCQYHF